MEPIEKFVYWLCICVLSALIAYLSDVPTGLVCLAVGGIFYFDFLMRGGQS